MKRYTVIFALFLIGLALFPFGWLGTEWSDFGTVINMLFATTAAHIIGHSLIFMLVGGVILLLVPALRTRPLIYMLLVLCLAVMHEGLQLIAYKQRPLLFDDFFDVGIDLLAAGLLFLGGRLFWSKRNGHGFTRMNADESVIN